ncbi:PP2C family protein-serine/threonine phosphatase [Rhodocaloribacter sp.]
MQTRSIDHTSAAGRVEAQLKALDAIGRLMLAGEFDLQTLLDEIVRLTAARLQAPFSALWLLDEATDRLVLRAVYGLPRSFLENGPVFSGDSAFRAAMNRGRHTVHVYDVRRDGDVEHGAEVLAEGLGSMMAAPLFRRGKLLGSLAVYTVEPRRFTPEEHALLRIVANQAALAIELNRLYEERLRYRELERDLAAAAEVQAHMLPARAPRLKGYRLAGWSRPWRYVGGDFYDYVRLPGKRLGLVVGDVSGKGVQAALLMAAARAALRSQMESCDDLPTVLRRVNRTLYHDTRPEQFVTLFVGVLAPEARTLTYVNAGHNPPLLFRARRTRRLTRGGIPVGLMPDSDYVPGTVHLRPGDVLLLYTDGFTDVLCDHRRVFGEARLKRAARELLHEPPRAFIEKLDAALLRAGCAGDDRTAVALKVT